MHVYMHTYICSILYICIYIYIYKYMYICVCYMNIYRHNQILYANKKCLFSAFEYVLGYHHH